MTTYQHNEKGFTLVETLVAILILSLTVGALLTLAASGFFTIRYAKNDIVANNLLQESLEFIRNNRDTTAQQGRTWSDWKASFPAACFEPEGCSVNVYASQATDRVFVCANTPCYLSYFPDNGFYGYAGDNIFGSSMSGQETSFVRTITMRETTTTTDPEMIVTATMSWMNGLNTKKITQSIILSRWNLQ